MSALPQSQPVEMEEPVSDTRPPVLHTRRHITWMVSLQSLLTTIVIAVFVITFILQAFQIPSGSMENTLLIGDYLLVDKQHFGSSGILPKIIPYDTIHRDDIIVFLFPIHPEEHFVKRVIGIPGDHIKLVHGTVFVNGVAQSEPFVLRKTHSYDSYRDDFPTGRYVNPDVEARWWVQLNKLIDDEGELIVPENNYFVLGDNRENSDDSRYWGFVPRGNIIGRPLVIYLSVNHDDDDAALDPSLQDGKLLRLAYMLHDLGGSIRWDRCLRLVH